MKPIFILAAENVISRINCNVHEFFNHNVSHINDIKILCHIQERDRRYSNDAKSSHRLIK